MVRIHLPDSSSAAVTEPRRNGCANSGQPGRALTASTLPGRGEMTEDTGRCSESALCMIRPAIHLGQERLIGEAGCVGKKAKRMVQAKAHG